jgi:hypothetical protein
MPLNRLSAMRRRMHLIEKAQTDYLAGRNDSTVLYLVPTMDGFVQELDPNGGGLHARAPDGVVAWDSVVGHHLGLANAHRTFTKSFFKTHEAEVYELYRNGILHGMVLRFDSDVVATKAWNRLFAVADWVASRERQAIPPKPQRTLWQVLADSAATKERTRRANEALEKWKPSHLAEGDEGFTDDDVFQASLRYLSAWQTRNCGAMAALIPRDDETPGRRAGEVREMCQDYVVEGFAIKTLRHQAPAVCMAKAELSLDGEVHQAWLRWVREDEAAAERS